MSSVAQDAREWYRLSGHVLLRYGSAHLVDLVTAALQIRADLATARVLATEDEARLVLGGSLRFRRGHRYLAGADGIYVISGNAAITYISTSKKFRNLSVRGRVQRSRSGRLHTTRGRARRTGKEPI